MTVFVDDAGWGDPVGGVIIGIYRVETEEYLSREIEVTHFQPPNFTQRTYLNRGLELVLEGFRCLFVQKDEPIHVCRGVVLDGVREGLTHRGYEVIPTKIEGRLQELVEASLVESLARLGLPNIPTVSGKERFFRQLEWIQEDLRRRERFAKTGWKNWPTKLRHWKPKWRQRNRGPTTPPVIIKLGGSVVTDKTKPSTARLDTIELLVKEISAVKAHPIILVHGGGSFGHFLAEKYELHQGGRSKRKKLGVTQTIHEMTRLGQIILAAFQKANRPAVSIHSSSIIVSLRGRIAHMDLEALRFFLNGNFIPILSGDVTADSVTGFTIVSGDQIVMYLARLLEAPLVIFASDVDGLYTADPKLDPSAQRIPLITPETMEEVLEKVAMGAAADAADVTEGMRGKITEIFKGLPESGEAIVCDLRQPGTLARILAGKEVPSTRLRQKSAR
ncbi:MAG: isopentenyl phosphate kinase [Promethearchaeota archaeon]